MPKPSGLSEGSLIGVYVIILSPNEYSDAATRRADTGRSGGVEWRNKPCNIK